jgi:hypothetical protein
MMAGRKPYSPQQLASFSVKTDALESYAKDGYFNKTVTISGTTIGANNNCAKITNISILVNDSVSTSVSTALNSPFSVTLNLSNINENNQAKIRY